MKFKQMMDMNMVPEWRDQYLDYQGLDVALRKAIDGKNLKSSMKGVDLYYQLIKSNQKFSSQFISECRAQLDKINSFHREKLDEMRGKYNNLQDQLDQVLSSAIYREVQPELSPTSSAFRDRSARSSICSISDIFKNFRAKTGSPSNFVDTPKISVTDFDGSCSHLARSDRSRLSFSSIFSNSFKSSCSSIGGDLGGSSGAGNGQVSLYTRKLSEGFISCAQRFTNNLNPPPSVTLDLNIRSRLNKVLPVARSNGGESCEWLKGDSSKRSQTLAGATSQPKKTIIAFYKKKIRNLRFAFREFYLNLVLFEQYTQLNHNGFEQILRKHDRMFASTLGRKFYQDYVQTAEFYVNLQEVDQLIEGVEHIYTLHFEHGNRRRAIEKLQVPTSVYKPLSPMLDFRVGYELGTFVMLFVFVILVGLVVHNSYDWRTVFRLYRSPLLLIIFLLQAGISIVIWKHFKINHVLIFELNPRDNLSFHHFFEFASLLGIIWSISVLLFLFSERLGIWPSTCPLLVVVLIAIYIFNPTATCHHRARFWLLKILVSIADENNSFSR